MRHNLFPIPLLYIDDNPHDRDLVNEAAVRTDSAFALYTADSPLSAAPYFAFWPQHEPNLFPRPELVLLEYDMGTYTGTNFLVWLRVTKHMTGIPVIMYSGPAGSHHVLDCYEAGANHFLWKPQSFPAIKGIMLALDLCMFSTPPRFGRLTDLPEYEPDPRAALAVAAIHNQFQ